jgi:hypothetical protein
MKENTINASQENSGEPFGELKRQLEKLASQIGLRRGNITLLAHDGMLTKVDVRSFVNIPRRGAIQLAAARTGNRTQFRQERGGTSGVFIQDSSVIEFAQAKLEKLLLATVGRFGQVDAELIDGIVVDLSKTGRVRF